ncbi:DUF4129 domain-containing protein [Radiobacillus deserti]|uniref:DUF4129 domain-containing protein n=2 Tax=Radiobacillus deserti TaxID=2594883 RepID=A0A516KL04_9BACI|nr:DUF4129 domain-containing protein [Radiobacillus deserti]
MNLGFQQRVYQSIIYLCGFLLFWEWLRPLEEISDTGSVPVFVLYAAFCFLISFFQVRWWISFPLKLAGMLFILDSLFLSEALFSKPWFTVLYLHITYNIDLIMSQSWGEMTPVFRSALFLILLWLMSYLLYYWFVVAKRIFTFVLLTFIYMTVLDTFTAYEADQAIVRTFIVSLLALGLSNITKEVEHEAISFQGLRKLWKVALPLILFVSLSTAVGFASPKLDPQWPDPVPFIKSTAENAGFGEGGSVIQKVGYGEDDSRLGGSFVQDESPVFQALSPDKQYWRIESKDVYTGKGWERSEGLDYQIQENGKIDLNMFEGNVKTEKRQAFIKFEQNAFFSRLVYPYGVREVSGEEEFDYLLDQQSGIISTEGSEQQQYAQNYQVTYDSPSFSFNQMREASEDDPEEIKEQYLQLPRSLPRRVGELAEDIIGSNDNRYDKVKAVEQYFNSNGFEYQTKDVPVPDRNEDYVDQFLFESKVGYCDNFSTSMVVLLRTLDIPARWVKGFSGGERVSNQPEDIPDDLDLYQITNSNAHSWVEVYFPEIGWVPFEPTQGFNSSVDFYEEVEEEVQQDDQPAVPASQQEGAAGGKPQEIEDEPAASTGGVTTPETSSFGWLKWLLLAIPVVAAVLVYFSRYKWMTAWKIRKFKGSDEANIYQDAYHYLLKVLAHKGIHRVDGQTLREFAKEVDRQFETNEMSRLTHQYERILYRNDEESTQWMKMTELWENLIKRALS